MRIFDGLLFLIPLGCDGLVLLIPLAGQKNLRSSKSEGFYMGI